MKLQISEKDKKLLLYLAIGVIIVVIGYWGVRPVVKSIMDIDTEKEEQSKLKEINEMKIADLPWLEADNKKYEEDIVSAKKDFFPMMTSNEVDKYFTDLALGYNLYSYDLNIEMPTETAGLEPYMYSEKALLKDDTSSEEKSTEGSSSKNSIEAAEKAANKEASNGSSKEEEDSSFVGIYKVTVTMRLGGDEANLNSFIDKVSSGEMKIRVCSFSWSTTKNAVARDDETYEIQEEKVLTIKLEIYMCEA